MNEESKKYYKIFVKSHHEKKLFSRSKQIDLTIRDSQTISKGIFTRMKSGCSYYRETICNHKKSYYHGINYSKLLKDDKIDIKNNIILKENNNT